MNTDAINMKPEEIKNRALVKMAVFQSILFFSTSFAVHWWSDSLFDILWIFALPIYVILFIIFIICLVLSIKLIKAKEIKVYCFTFAIIVITVIMTFFFPYKRAKLLFEYKYLTPKRMEIVNKIRSGEIDDSSRLIDLPKGYRMLSSDGTVYVGENDSEGTEVEFWVFRGMLSGSRIVVYSDGGEYLIRKNEGGHPITKVQKLGDEWYYVETDY